MLKRLVIVAIPLFFVFSVQAYNQPHKAQDGDKGQKPAEPTPSTPIQQTSGPQLQPIHNEHVDADVRVIKAPEKDAFDITTLVINIVLGIVGIAGVGIGVCTLLYIKKQANLMKEHAEHLSGLVAAAKSNSETLKDSVAAAQKSADAALAQIEMVKSKERAQLRIEFDPLSLTYDQKADGYPIRFKVILDGLTRATILYESIAAYLADAPGTKQMPWEPLGIGGTFRPDSSPFESVIFIQADSDFCENETDHQRVNLVRDGKLDAYVAGRIRYRDLFGDEWELGIDRVWHQWSSWSSNDGKITGVWSEAGNSKGDYHRKIEQPPNPN